MIDLHVYKIGSVGEAVTFLVGMFESEASLSVGVVKSIYRNKVYVVLKSFAFPSRVPLLYTHTYTHTGTYTHTHTRTHTLLACFPIP